MSSRTTLLSPDDCIYYTRKCTVQTVCYFMYLLTEHSSLVLVCGTSQSVSRTRHLKQEFVMQQEDDDETQASLTRVVTGDSDISE